MFSAVGDHQHDLFRPVHYVEHFDIFSRFPQS